MKNALVNPPEKPDLYPTALGVISAALVFCKSLGDLRAADKFVALPFVFCCLGLVAGALIVADHIRKYRKVYPFHEQALQYVVELIALQSAPAQLPSAGKQSSTSERPSTTDDPPTP